MHAAKGISGQIKTRLEHKEWLWWAHVELEAHSIWPSILARVSPYSAPFDWDRIPLLMAICSGCCNIAIMAPCNSHGVIRHGSLQVLHNYSTKVMQHIRYLWCRGVLKEGEDNRILSQENHCIYGTIETLGTHKKTQDQQQETFLVTWDHNAFS